MVVSMNSPDTIRLKIRYTMLHSTKLYYAIKTIELPALVPGMAIYACGDSYPIIVNAEALAYFVHLDEYYLASIHPYYAIDGLEVMEQVAKEFAANGWEISS